MITRVPSSFPSILSSVFPSAVMHPFLPFGAYFLQTSLSPTSLTHHCQKSLPGPPGWSSGPHSTHYFTVPLSTRPNTEPLPTQAGLPTVLLTSQSPLPLSSGCFCWPAFLLPAAYMPVSAASLGPSLVSAQVLCHSGQSSTTHLSDQPKLPPQDHTASGMHLQDTRVCRSQHH